MIDTEFDRQLQPPQAKNIQLSSTLKLKQDYIEDYKDLGGDIDAQNRARAENISNNDKVSAATNANKEDQVTIETLEDSNDGETSL